MPSLVQALQAQLALDMPARQPSAQDGRSGMTPTQSLAVSRAQLAQALRDSAWVLLLQRWLERNPEHG